MNENGVKRMEYMSVGFSLTESYDYEITKTKIYTTYLVDFDKHLHDVMPFFISFNTCIETPELGLIEKNQSRVKS